MDNEAQGKSVEAKQPAEPVVPMRGMLRGLRVFLICLLLFDVGFFVFNLAALLRGDHDDYHNQHLRLVTGSVGQLFLVSAIFVNVSATLSPGPGAKRKAVLGGVLLACAIAVIAAEFLLAR